MLFRPTWLQDHILPRFSWTHPGGGDQGETNHGSDSQSCPWWQRQTGWGSGFGWRQDNYFYPKFIFHSLCNVRSAEHKPASDQKGTKTVEAEEVEDSKVGPTGIFLSRQEVRLGVTLLPVHWSHHDLLPSLSSSTSEYINTLWTMRLIIVLKTSLGPTFQRSYPPE